MKKFLPIVVVVLLILVGILVVGLTRRFGSNAAPAPTMVPTQTAVIVKQTVIVVQTALPVVQTQIVDREVTKVVPQTQVVTQTVKETVVVVVTATPVPATATVTPTSSSTPNVVQTEVAKALATMGLRMPAAQQTPVVTTTIPLTATAPLTSTVSLTATTATTVTTSITGTVKVTTTVVSAVPVLSSESFKLDYKTTWYRSPFTKTTDALTDTATLETFAEPGVLLDNTAAFDHMSAADTPILVPEGGYAYVAIGGMTLSHNSANLTFDFQDRNIYLVLVRGLPDDGTPADLNQVVLASNYVRSAGIYSPIPAGAYVSLSWWLQQVKMSLGSPNCGMSCEIVTTVLVDLKTHTYRVWTVQDPKNLRNWVRVQP